MKKLLGILVLGLLWCNTLFAACLEGDCKNGLGVYLYSGGCKYVGEYKDSFKHGEGTYTCPKKFEYFGEWKLNLFHGYGTYTWADGDKYIGEFKDSHRHGQGSHIYANGKIKKGIWKNGKLVKKTKKKKSDDTIVQQLKDLEEMYKSGALTKEEYTKATKKLLN